ncbi:MAG: hypothetical protein IJ143_01920, partial [Neisseriaceae bacterium]|nr:hypothetical protein [Neisseriaceae bacterium]
MTNKTFTDIAQYTLLSEATYANFSSFDKTKVETAIINIDPKKPKPESLAKMVTKDWKVIAHYQDRIDDNESSFSGTLFKNDNDEYVLALKGTKEPQKDLIDTDGNDIAVDGLAHRQIVDMYNFWQQMTAKKGETYKVATIVTDEEYNAKYQELCNNLLTNTETQKLAFLESLGSGYFLDSTVDLPFQSQNGTIKKIIFQDSDKVYSDERAKGLGVISEDQTVMVTGHSLGGHLTAAFSRLFPENTEHAYMMNGAGFGTDKNPLAEADGMQTYNINSVFSKLGGASSFDSSKITNIIGDKNYPIMGFNVVSQDWTIGLYQPGEKIDLFIESGSKDVYGHGVSQMTDTISVMSLFAKVDSHINNGTTQNALAKLNPIFDNIDKDDSQALEKVLFNFEKLLSGKNDSSIKQITTDDRNALYEKISELSDKIEEQKIKGELVSLMDKNSAEIEQKALSDDDDGLAYRYALKLLTPFTFTGEMANSHNQNGELDLCSKDNPNGMTAEYIKDRSAMLKALSSSYSEQIYDDMTTGIHLEMPEDLANGEYYSDHPEYTQRKTVFGTDSDDKNIEGSAYADSLYGGAGDDVLIAGKATTYTDSGDGYDIPETHDDGVEDYLEGGTGKDTYHVGNKDKIFDSDMTGSIHFNGTELNKTFHSLIARQPESDEKDLFWYELDKDGNKTGISAKRSGDDLKIFNQDNTFITIKNYFALANQLDNGGFNGLNITLLPKEEDKDDTQPENPDYLLWRGDIRPETDDNGRYKVNWLDHSQRNENGEIINGSHQENFNDTIAGEAGKSNQIYGLTGNDALLGQDKDDLIDGGNGDDLISGGGGIDTIYGGSGNDYIASNFSISTLLRQSDKDTWTPHNSYVEIISQGSTWGVYRDETGNTPIELGGDHYRILDPNEQAGDLLYGGSGDDMVVGGNNNDIIYGDEKDNESTATQKDGNDNLFGAGGDDLIYGNGGNDIIYGDGLSEKQAQGTLSYIPIDEHGNDTIFAGDGNDTVRGQGGDDVIFGAGGDDWLNGDFGTTVDVEPLETASGDDFIDGGDGNEEMHGAGGNDHLVGGDGDDRIWGDHGHFALSHISGNDMI